jgi:hypothetical protein
MRLRNGTDDADARRKAGHDEDTGWIKRQASGRIEDRIAGVNEEWLH